MVNKVAERWYDVLPVALMALGSIAIVLVHCVPALTYA